MKVVRMEVDFNVYLWAVSGHEMNKVSSNLPPDARVIAVDIDNAHRSIFLTVESADFADVPERFTIPAWTPTLTVETTELLMLADLVSKRHDEVEEENRVLRERLWKAGIMK